MDALRFSLQNYTLQGRDINLDIMRVHGYRNFCNKLYNTSVFANRNFKDYTPSDTLPGVKNYNDLSFNDKWILSRLNAAIAECDRGFKEYDFAGYTNAIYN